MPRARPWSAAGWAAFLSLFVLAAACGTGEDDAGDAAAPDATQRPTNTRVVDGVTPLPATPLPDEPVAATPGAPAPDPDPPPPRPTPSYRTKSEPAPIDDVELLIRESFPPQYALRIVSGLPSGCHQYEATTVQRSGTAFTVTVTNLAPDDPGVACTAIYGQHEQTVELASDLISGTAYTVEVNDRTLEFTAQ
jgi:hypothetical protein